MFLVDFLREEGLKTRVRFMTESERRIVESGYFLLDGLRKSLFGIRNKRALMVVNFSINAYKRLILQRCISYSISAGEEWRVKEFAITEPSFNSTGVLIFEAQALTHNVLAQQARLRLDFADSLYKLSPGSHPVNFSFFGSTPENWSDFPTEVRKFELWASFPGENELVKPPSNGLVRISERNIEVKQDGSLLRTVFWRPSDFV